MVPAAWVVQNRRDPGAYRMTRMHALDEGNSGGLLSPVRRQYRLHGPGVLYLLITFFLAVGAVNSQNNLLFFVFGLALAGVLISGLISGPPLMHLRARRLEPASAHVGESATLRYAVGCRGGLLSAMGLEIRELEAPSSRVTPAGVLCLKPGSERVVSGSFVPERRGPTTLRGFSISTTYPLGLLRKVLIFEQPQTIRVAPRRVALRPMPWQRAGREGVTLSATASRRGSSTEFYALRSYVPGDPPRLIAWKPSARVGELVVREQAASAPPKIWIRIDEPDGRIPRHLVERGAALVSALARDGVQAGFAVGLTGRGVGTIRPVSGPRQVRAIHGTMAMLGLGGGRPVNESVPPPGLGTLQVHVRYSSNGRSGGSSKFLLSAEDLHRWLAPGVVPPEFRADDGPLDDRSLIGSALSRLAMLFGARGASA